MSTSTSASSSTPTKKIVTKRKTFSPASDLKMTKLDEEMFDLLNDAVLDKEDEPVKKRRISTLNPEASGSSPVAPQRPLKQKLEQVVSQDKLLKQKLKQVEIAVNSAKTSGEKIDRRMHHLWKNRLG